MYLYVTPSISASSTTKTRPPVSKSALKDKPNSVFVKETLEDLSTPSSGPTFETVSLKDFSSLYDSNPANKVAIEHIIALYEHEKYTGTSEVPTRLSVLDMKDLLAVFPEEKEIKRSFKFFFNRECARHNSGIRKAERRVMMVEKKREKYNLSDIKQFDNWSVGIWDEPEENLIYGLWHNSLLSRIPKQATRDYRHRHLLRQTAMFGQKLIIDLDYDQYMKLYECRLLAGQIGFLYYENRSNRDYPDALPFDVHFTNVRNGQQTMEAIEKHIKRTEQLGGYFHHESYLNYPKLFPKERLVYLSPHASVALRNYDHDDIYILGGYNDRTSHMAVSHVKAQQEGIRCYRLPLDENVLWKQGSRNLCLNQVAAILHAVKSTGNWKDAVAKCTPQRKIKSTDEMLIEDQIRAKKMARRVKDIQKSLKIKVAGRMYNVEYEV